MTKVTIQKKAAYKVIPGDIIRIPSMGFRSVTETEYNLVDNTVVFTCGSEEAMHEVGVGSTIEVFDTLPPEGVPLESAGGAMRVAVVLVAVLAFCFTLGVVISQ